MPMTPPANGAALRHLTNVHIARQKTSPAMYATTRDTFEMYVGHPPANPHTPVLLITSLGMLEMFL